MPPSDASDVIKKGFTEAKVKWGDKILSENIMVSGDYPHSIQILGHNLINNVVKMYEAMKKHKEKKSGGVWKVTKT